MQHRSHGTPYRNLLWMLVLSFGAMYVLMYAMVNDFGSVYLNLNQAYMALLMAAPMGLIELVLMRSMYPDRRLNAIVMAACAVVLAVSWFLIRQQTAIGDTQFLRSMIPHHSGAILMCERAALADREIHALCRSIAQSQQSEIGLMKAMLDRRGQ